MNSQQWGQQERLHLPEFGRRRRRVQLAAVLRHEPDKSLVLLAAELDPSPELAGAPATPLRRHVLWEHQVIV